MKLIWNLLNNRWFLLTTHTWLQKLCSPKTKEKSKKKSWLWSPLFIWNKCLKVKKNNFLFWHSDTFQFIEFPPINLRLGICSDGLLNVILHEGHSCPKLQNPPLMRIDSTTPPSGFAQNDSMDGGVLVSYQNERRIQSCSCGADYSQL